MNLVRMGSVETPQSNALVVAPRIRLEGNDLDSCNESNIGWNDVGSGLYSGSVLNGATYLQTNGGIFAFDGTDESVVIQNSSSDWTLTASPITLQVWVRLNSLTNSYGSLCGILGKQSGEFGADGYVLSVTSTGQLRITTNGTSFLRTHNTAQNAITTNSWYFLTAVMSLSSAAGTVKSYINDSLGMSSSHGAADTCLESNSLILARGYQRNANPETYLNGQIGAFYAYNRELTANEISQNFNATRRRYGV